MRALPEGRVIESLTTLSRQPGSLTLSRQPGSAKGQTGVRRRDKEPYNGYCEIPNNASPEKESGSRVVAEAAATSWGDGVELDE